MPPKWRVASAIFPIRPHQTTLGRVYRITSLSQAKARPRQFLRQNRGH